MKIQACFVLLAVLSCCAAYNVLVVFPMPSRSHANLGMGIVKSLLQAGHHVTYITPYPSDKALPENLKQINVSMKFEDVTSAANLHDMFNNESTTSFNTVKIFAHEIATKLIGDEIVQNLLKDTNQKFDAVVTEWFFSEIYAGFAQVLQCPWILFSPMGMNSVLEYLVDEVQSPAVQPMVMLGYSVPMTLKERIINSLVIFSAVFSTAYTDHPRDALVYQKYFGPIAEARGVQLAEYTEAAHNVSILLVNSHYSLEQATKLPPNTVQVGGYHIDPNTAPLPKDLQDLLDSAPHGVIYFSMGSVLKSADIPEEKQKALMNIFRGLKETVLWKFETELPDVPKNVHIRPWFPQPSILAHKNVKIFITHGGLLSTTEAIYFGVPLIGIPVFGDQPMNMDAAVKKGYAIKIKLRSPQFTDSLGEAIQKMLGDPSYRKTIQHLSMLFKDRPAHPASLVSYWTEHAVRTAGAQHLRTAASAVPAYQRYLLDILAILLAVLALIIYAVRALLRCLFCRSTTTQLNDYTSKNSNKKKRN